MKWELVVTDMNAGKTGRVRVEAPDEATAQRIATEKGWVVSSVRLFEPAAASPLAPVVSPRLSTAPVSVPALAPEAPYKPAPAAASEYTQTSASPPVIHEEGESSRYSPYQPQINPQEHAAGEKDESPYPGADFSAVPAEEESDPYVEPAPYTSSYVPSDPETESESDPEPIRVEDQTSRSHRFPPGDVRSGATGLPANAAPFGSRKLPAVQAILETPSTVTASRPIDKPAKSRTGPLRGLAALIFWAAGLALIAWGISQLAFYFGYARSDPFTEDSAAGISTNRLNEIRGIMRAVLGGVLLASGFLSALLGTLLVRESHHRS